jgi:hypothetical protein
MPLPEGGWVAIGSVAWLMWAVHLAQHLNREKKGSFSPALVYCGAIDTI